jgi:hypothetical protein
MGNEEGAAGSESMRETLHRLCGLGYPNYANRTACLHMTMCDKIALSVILLFIEGMAQIIEQNTGK